MLKSISETEKHLKPPAFRDFRARPLAFLPLEDATARALNAEESKMDLFEVGLLNTMKRTTSILLLTATTSLAPTGQTSGVICIGQDITNLKDRFYFFVFVDCFFCGQ